MRILLSGGGTMGSVTPLLAIKEKLSQEPDQAFLWIGTSSGPEKAIIEQNQIAFKSIPAGKLRRYFDWRNFVDPFLIVLGFLKSIWLIWRFKPDVILTAGSFVSVPLVWAGALLRKKILVHQQDLRIGLANKIMQRFATLVTVAFEELNHAFPQKSVVVTGNPVRSILFQGNKERAWQKFNLEPNLATVLVVGGGIGSEIINQTFVESARELTKFCQIIHVTGGKDQSKWIHHPEVTTNSRYHAYEFLTDALADAFAISDLMVSRAGLGFLSEIAALQKPAIIIPIPNNQQIENAEFFHKQQAIVYVRQEDLEKDYIVKLIQDLFEHPERLHQLSQNIAQVMPANASDEYVKLIKKLTKPA
jgi:UDP-N-acetylglucosamine--N-acetylmuramyl-(pentapeptide) pyrophosphoryl-undecaprenol N-acetylglucosamine transferase